MAVTTRDNVDEVFAAFLNEIGAQVIESLIHIGEQAVSIAKQVPPERGFTDRTGNLRSSIGYVVALDGKPINMAFEAVKGGAEGIAEGERLALQIAGRYGTGDPVLVVVAGMNYAVHVESKGRDVLTSAEKYAEKAIAREMADLVTNVKNAFK